MSASASARTRVSKPVPRRSSTGHPSARPDSSPALLSAPHSSPSATVIAAQAKPIGPTGTCIHPNDAPPRLAPTFIAAIKSP